MLAAASDHFHQIQNFTSFFKIHFFKIHFFEVRYFEEKMMSNSFSMVFILLCISIFLCSVIVQSNTVTYDEKAIIINGQRRLLISGSIHYPRSTPEEWEDLIRKAKGGGLNVIDSYVFWNLHESTPGIYDFGGGKDLVRFIKTVHEAGLFVILRVGPYVHAECNFGGIPLWLKFVPGISFRTDNEPFKNAMQGFVEKIVQMMKDNSLFYTQGGPIILCQIENEYGDKEKALGPAGYNYMTWAANMAVNQNTGVPWVMCKQPDAPDPVINTCNGFYCDNFTPNSPVKPKMWTEAWSGWFSEFTVARPRRPVNDLALAVALFFAKGGTFVNYYMYHGGTNFNRFGGSYITTSYDYDAPLDESGLIRNRKYHHLRMLHNTIRECETALLNSNPTVESLGPRAEAHVFSSSNGNCAAFLANLDTKSGIMVTFNGKSYFLHAWSVSILPDCENVAFNTAQVEARTSKIVMLPTSSKLQSWRTNDEYIYNYDEKSEITSMGLLDQVNVTKDKSDYLWYSTKVDISSPEIRIGQQIFLSLMTHSDGVYVFLNGRLMGSKYGTADKRGFRFTVSVDLQAGTNYISLLNVLVGLPSGGLYYEQTPTGLGGSIFLEGLAGGRRLLTHQKWSYQVGLNGERNILGSFYEPSSVDWVQASLANSQKHSPLIWHMAEFNKPEGEDPLSLDMKSMYKGRILVNGRSIGRYWTALGKGACKKSNRTGSYRPKNWFGACNHPTQRWYLVPSSWLKPQNNVLVILEERGGDVSKISLARRTTKIL